MRLLFVCTDMRIGGAERHWATLIPALHDRGVDVRVLCLTGEGPLFGELVARGVPSAVAHLRRRSDPAGLRRALGYASAAPRRRGKPGRERAARGRGDRPAGGSVRTW